MWEGPQDTQGRGGERGTAVDPAKELGCVEEEGGLSKGDLGSHSHVCVLEIYPGNGTEDEWWRARMEPEDIRGGQGGKVRAVEAGSQSRWRQLSGCG